MYSLPYFKEMDEKTVIEFIHQHPFAFIAGCDQNNKPVATQIPVFIEKRESKLFLSGHLMKQTDHHKAFEHNSNVLCVFTGHHTYVSATWYPDPHQASTWNYMSVHVKGQIKFLDEEALVNVLRKTSLHFENGNTASATVYDNLPDDYRNRLLKTIVAFEVEVELMDTVFKLSQNKDRESYRNIIDQLKQQVGDEKMVAKEMEERKDQLFS